jgi:hypothetical protein
MAAQQRPAPSGWAVFTGTLLFLIGCFQAIQGLINLLNPRVVTVTGGEGVVIWTYSTWGWIQLVIGALLILVSFGLFAAQSWARWVAVALAALSAVAQIGFFTAFPLWSLLVIVLDVVVIWQLSSRWSPAPPAPQR